MELVDTVWKYEKLDIHMKTVAVNWGNILESKITGASKYVIMRPLMVLVTLLALSWRENKNSNINNYSLRAASVTITFNLIYAF